MKTKLILAILLVVLTLLSSIGGTMLLRERSRLKSNYLAQIEREKVLTDGISYERTRNDNLMVKVSALELSNSEMRKTQDEMMEGIKEMKIKLRKVESYSATNTTTTHNIETTIKDTILYDTIPVEYIEHRTQWIDLTGYKVQDKFNLTIETRDSLIQVVYWERAKILGFLPLGRKRYSQKIMSANPHSKITYSDVIIPRKRR